VLDLAHDVTREPMLAVRSTLGRPNSEKCAVERKWHLGRFVDGNLFS
jgi:hypothetical protein